MCSLFYLVLYWSLFVLPCTCTFHCYLHLTISYLTEAFSLSWSLAVTWRTEVPCWNKVSYKNLSLNGTALKQHNAILGTRTAHQAVGLWYSLFKAFLNSQDQDLILVILLSDCYTCPFTLRKKVLGYINLSLSSWSICLLDAMYWHYKETLHTNHFGKFKGLIT